MMLDNFKGKLLVAKPHVMKDPHFAKSVVYIYEQTDKVVNVFDKLFKSFSII